MINAAMIVASERTIRNIGIDTFLLLRTKKQSCSTVLGAPPLKTFKKVIPIATDQVAAMADNVVKAQNALWKSDAMSSDSASEPVQISKGGWFHIGMAIVINSAETTPTSPCSPV